jgi:transcriptional regulator with XRE-family HTH domain
VETSQNLTQRLERLKFAQNWTDEELAEEIGVSRRMLYLVRTGKSKLTRKLEWKVAQVEATTAARTPARGSLDGHVTVQEIPSNSADSSEPDWTPMSEQPALVTLAEISGLTESQATDLRGALPSGASVDYATVHPFGLGFEGVALAIVKIAREKLTERLVVKLVEALLQRVKNWALDRKPHRGQEPRINGRELRALDAEQLRYVLLKRARRVQNQHDPQPANEPTKDGLKPVHGEIVASLSKPLFVEDTGREAELRELLGEMRKLLERVESVLTRKSQKPGRGGVG